MKSLCKIALFLFVVPASLLAQPGVRMSADFLPLEVGNRWVYDVVNEAGQKTGSIEFAVQEYRIVGGRSFYLLTQFPFVPDGASIKLVRYDRQERLYMRMVDNEEGPLFLADGTRASSGDVVITRHGKPAGVLIGFKTEDDWFDYRLENDPRFLQRVEQARASIRAGRGVKLEDVK